ncbi:MAG: hypothetical protein ABJ004_20105 [Cyclobacteriaceae bacterium]
MKERRLKHFAHTYNGSMVYSGTEEILEQKIRVEMLTDILVKVSFETEIGTVVFRALASAHDEGNLLYIQNRVTGEYILQGVSGFVYKKTNVHGGFVNNLNSFYFHLRMDFFSGTTREYYFVGEEAVKERVYDKVNDSTKAVA